MQKAKENPIDLLNSPLGSFESLASTSDNEPGKQNRVRFGTDDQGTAIYMRLPTGKIGEDFEGWLFSPLQTLKNKESQFMRPIHQTIDNDLGFGRQVYDPSEPGLKGSAKALEKIVANFMKSQIPIDSLQAGESILPGGSGDQVDFLKVVGPLLGFTFSKGAPGGPAVGELFTIDKQHRSEITAAMPDVKQALKAGDSDKAVDLMQQANMTRQEIRMVLKYASNPGARLSGRALKQFNQVAPEYEQERMDRFRNSQ
jgi:hypothetical protein